MAVDVEVQIANGRPSFVFPAPDDYALTVRPFGSTDPLPTAPLQAFVTHPPHELDGRPLRTGYPWLIPRHPIHRTGLVTAVGVRWQSLIVSPTKLPWMAEPPVASDAARWWRRLREVECSWVSSRGEAERFLYHEGPTLSRLPVDLVPSGDGLATRPAQSASAVLLPDWRADRSAGGGPARDALLVRVSGGRVAAGGRLRVPVSMHQPAAVEVRETLKPHAVADELERHVRRMGLTASEAAGMIACWRKKWFESDGRRVLLFLEQKDYDLFCPMRVRPTPAELVRVGVVWLELE